MRVSVQIDLNLRKKETTGQPVVVELKEGDNTLADVLRRLSSMYSDLRLIEDGNTSDDICGLHLNGESYSSFPEGLKTRVNEGDVILLDIYVDLMSGG
jgi:molybdopterin converting factor small subunit